MTQLARCISGKSRSYTSNKTFAVDLGIGTSVTIGFHGHMAGIFAGHQLSGFGHLEYVYVAGSSELVRTDIGGSALGPASIPVAPTAALQFDYAPGGRCKANVSIETTGTVDDAGIYGFKHKKDRWKMKGRTDLLSIFIVQAVNVDLCGIPEVWDANSCNSLRTNGALVFCSSPEGPPQYGRGCTAGTGLDLCERLAQEYLDAGGCAV